MNGSEDDASAESVFHDVGHYRGLRDGDRTRKSWGLLENAVVGFAETLDEFGKILERLPAIEAFFPNEPFASLQTGDCRVDRLRLIGAQVIDLIFFSNVVNTPVVFAASQSMYPLVNFDINPRGTI